MTTATLEIYHALLEAGVPKDQAEAAAKAVITRQEAKEFLATKEEILTLKADLYKAMLIQTGAIIAILAGLATIFRLLS